MQMQLEDALAQICDRTCVSGSRARPKLEQQVPFRSACEKGSVVACEQLVKSRMRETVTDREDGTNLGYDRPVCAVF